MKKNSIHKIQETLKKEAYIFTIRKNLHYLTENTNLEGSLLVTKNDVVFFTDFRYYEEASNNLPIEVVDFLGKKNECIYSYLKKNDISKVYFEKDISYGKAIKDKSYFENKGIVYEPAGSLLEKLRSVKTEDELLLIRKSAEINDGIFRFMLDCLRDGASEKELKEEMEKRIKFLGGDGTSFDLIVLFGPRSSMPHGVSGDYLLEEGMPILADIGTDYRGYASDMTRTISYGRPSNDFIEIYEIVKNVQQKALMMVKPGARVKDIDQMVKDTLALQGYNLGHSTGHGVGLDIHEAPFINFNSEDVLQENMVITIEPGVYIPGKFGVRIEDLVLVTKDGYEILSKIDKELIICSEGRNTSDFNK